MRAKIVLPLLTIVALACGGGAPDPVVATIGVHNVSFVVPEGWQHYDHGREQRLETGDGDIILTDLGPVTAQGYEMVVVDARDRYRRGHREDAKQALETIEQSKWIDDTDTKEMLSREIAAILQDRQVEQAFTALGVQLERLPQPDLSSLANRALLDLNHGPRRDIEREEKPLVDGRDARRIVTWQRMTHDHRRWHVFVVNNGSLLVIRTSVGLEEILGPAFATVVGSLTFLEPEAH